ncbi:MAG TPA: MoxR family ATPase [Thermoanaerobaculia bacterium]|jgi:MoxR-like ATPase|nr:MoxR family ATPase [Thermoanaerobaculia bacterium]
MQTIADIATRFNALRGQLDLVILGQEKVKALAVTALLAGGHILLEGVPGTGKTLLSLALARLLGCRFRRIQFTPDLMPADLVGSNIFNQKTQEFAFRPGPLFTDVLLADEINRTPPRTQAALLESMQENAATVDGVRYRISPVFTVFATQNPVEFEGTYPLPEAQRDRFLFKISIDFPEAEDESRMLTAYAEGRRLHDDIVATLKPVISAEELLAARRTVANTVRVEPHIIKYIQEIVGRTRKDDAVQIGGGPRASLALLESSRAAAALQGRDYITPDDVKALVAPVLAHRVTLSPEAEMEGLALEDLLGRIFDQVEVPR